MRTHFRITAAMLLLLLGGCATTQPTRLTQRNFTPVSAVASRLALPELNTEAVAEVGDTMIEGGTVYRRDAIRLLQPIVHNGFSRSQYTLEIPAGILVARGISRTGALEGTFFQAQQPLPFHSMGVTATVTGGIFVPAVGDRSSEIYWHATDTGVPLVDPNSSIRFERTNHEEWRSDSFRRELVYNGRSAATIKLLYREFIEERIRPAFTQEVTYDLETGETIGFKGARFQVLDADNIRIKYIVLRHFD